jgi:ribosome maturation factor RimP
MSGGASIETRGSPGEQRIVQLVEPSVMSLGYELVRVLISGRQRPVIQIMAERADRAPMTVNDCAEISRVLSALLDVEDPVRGPYTLEISSPGIDRPLTRLGDFQRFAGHEARVETRNPLDGRRRFRGILQGIVEETSIRIDMPEGCVQIPFADIQRAKLVLTESLLVAQAQEQGDADTSP